MLPRFFIMADVKRQNTKIIYQLFYRHFLPSGLEWECAIVIIFFGDQNSIMSVVVCLPGPKLWNIVSFLVFICLLSYWGWKALFCIVRNLGQIFSMALKPRKDLETKTITSFFQSPFVFLWFCPFSGIYIKRAFCFSFQLRWLEPFSRFCCRLIYSFFNFIIFRFSQKISCEKFCKDGSQSTIFDAAGCLPRLCRFLNFFPANICLIEVFA